MGYDVRMRCARWGTTLRTGASVSTIALAALRATAGCGGDDDAGPGPLDASSEATGPEPGDAVAGDTSTSPPSPPGFCRGIVFFAGLDGTYVGLDGTDTPVGGSLRPLPYGSARLVDAGRFGGSVSLVEDDAAAADAAGAAVYYVEREGGAPVFPAKAGTVSLWYRGTALDSFAPGAPVFHRAMASLPPAPVLGGGIVLLAISDRFGLYKSTPSEPLQPLLIFPIVEVRRYLKKGAFNHFVTAWRQGAAGGPTTMMMLNGGTGDTFDASADAPSYADASPTDAGELRVPYRGYSSKPWETDASVVAFRLGGTGTSAARGEIDDVAVWNRVLSFEEMSEVYQANASIADACRLR